MAMRDSLDKIIRVYFSCVTAEPFEYKGKTYSPRDLRVSPDIFRGFICPPMCAGCCPRFSLDYLPEEDWPDGLALSSRRVPFNGREVVIWSDMQQDHNDYHCRNVNCENGRCMIHGHQPFSCDFELIRFIEFKDPDHPNYITQKLFGRGWAMKRVDGERGALCEMTPATEETKRDLVRKLRRLDQWCNHFGLATKLSTIIEWCDTGPHKTPLIV